MQHHFHITNNKREFCFEAELPHGLRTTLTYRWKKGDMLLMQTIVPAAAKDTGVGDALIKHVMEHARAHRLRVMVYCPVVAAYMTQHEEYNDLVVR